MGADIDPTEAGALRALRGGVEADPSTVPAMLGLASRAIAMSAFSVAKDILVGAALIDPDLPEVWSMLGSVYEKLRAPDKAERSFELAVGLDDENWPAAMALARLLAARGAHDRALSLTHWILSRAEDAPRVRFAAAQLRAELLERRDDAA